jgi:molybdate transport system regulatory protein
VPRVGPLKIKVQVFNGDERAFGPGRADLLEAIERDGSISAAARSLGMSYRYAWLLVDSMNRCFAERVVGATTGGKRGGGAALTDTGRRVLQAYRALEGDLAAAAEGDPLHAFRELLAADAAPAPSAALSAPGSPAASPADPPRRDRG